MAEIEISELESYYESILKKYEFGGINSLSPSEVCLTLISGSWEYYFFKATKTNWLSAVSGYTSSLLFYLKLASEESVKKKDQENTSLRQKAGKCFLELLDKVSVSHTGTPSDPSLKDDHILERLKDSLSKKGISLLNLLTKNDVNHDGLINKSELVTALEDLSLSTHDIVALIRIAGYRPGVDKIPIAGFADFLSKRGDDRKKEEYALFTKVLSAFNSKDKNLSKVFSFLDTNKDGVITLDELRQGLNKMNLSLSLAECKEVFTVIDKDRSGTISLDELKKRLSALVSNGHEVKSDAHKNNGVLEVVVLKGQKFKPGPKTVKVKFGHTEFTSGPNPDANPEWKFKNDFQVLDALNAPKEIEIEVFSGKKSEGKSTIPLTDIKSTDVYKGKIDLIVNKQNHGTVLLKCTWKEIESKPDINVGNVSLTLIRSENLSNNILFIIDKHNLVIPFKALGETFRIYKLKKIPNLVLKIQKIGESTIKELPIDDIINENKRTPYEIILDKTKIYIQILWEEFDPEDEKEDTAATKIQAAWRGYLVRHTKRIRNPRKMVYRKAANFENRRYLLVVYEDSKNIQIEVHPADSNQIGIDTVLSLNTYPLQDYLELIPKLTLHPGCNLGLVLDKVPIRGNLYIQFIQTRNLVPSLLYTSLANRTGNAITTKLPDLVFFSNLTFKKVPTEVQVKVLEVSDKRLIADTSIYWLHALSNPNEWSFNSVVPVGSTGSLLIKVKWEPLPDISNEEKAAIVIQKNWRAKKEREELKIRLRKNTLVGRKGIIVNNRVYLISVLEQNGSWTINLHPADNPQVPTYEILDTTTTSINNQIEDLFKIITIENEKIKLN